ncbi:hypothetical protein JYU34_002295 [Plutella xylostella]|uniref:Uncharacterized protein n=1 Tax=Plutella xylostella TaxID=51655 RepID=A0ABQ7R1Y4_PLUXY|nr:hypothetical protein JYU34_002295 [Plutella xylostella]
MTMDATKYTITSVQVGGARATFSPVLTFSRSFVSRQNTDKKWSKAGEQRENLRNRFHIHVSHMFLAFSGDSLENVERPLGSWVLPGWVWKYNHNVQQSCAV